MGRVDYRIAVVTPIKAAYFAVIVRRIMEVKGSREQAAKFIGLSTTALRRLLEDAYLTDKSARVVLSASKRLKEEQ